MKRKTIKDKKKKLPPLKRRRKVLWELCKLIVRKRYVKLGGTWDCYTCGSMIDEASKAHTSHCIPQAFGGLLLRYDLRNLRVTDFRCNVNYGGNAGVYLWKLLKEIGFVEVNKMFELLDKRKEKVDNEREFIENLIVEYRTILSDLK